MPPTITRSALRRLSSRLRETDPINNEDAGMLDQFVAEHGPVLLGVQSDLDAMVNGAGAVSGRPKTTASIVKKLRRSPRGPLHMIQDIAGVRVVVEESLRGQDRWVRRACQRVPNPDVKDRRDGGHMGYRAVHVVTKIDGFWVEIQIRTDWQDYWAQIAEELFTIFGDCIKYGPSGAEPAEAIEAIGQLGELSRAVAQMENALTEAERIWTPAAAVASLTEDEYESLLEYDEQLKARMDEADIRIGNCLVRLADLTDPYFPPTLGLNA